MLVINSSCYTRINKSGQVKVSICEIYNQVKWLHLFGKTHYNSQDIWNTVKGTLPSLTWFPPLLRLACRYPSAHLWALPPELSSFFCL